MQPHLFMYIKLILKTYIVRDCYSGCPLIGCIRSRRRCQTDLGCRYAESNPQSYAMLDIVATDAYLHSLAPSCQS